MKKKLLALLCCGTLAAAMLGGCGGKTADSTGAGADSSAAPAASTETAAATEAPAPASFVVQEQTGDPVYHFTFDGEDEGYTTVIQKENPDSAVTGATYKVVESSTYVDKEGAEQPITVQYADGPVGKAVYLDGKFGLKLPVEALDTQTYTISFWINADRLSTYGPTLVMGSNMEYSNTTEARTVTSTWANFTKSEWGTNSADIFPVLWDRTIGPDNINNQPWVYATDDSVHGKGEWTMVTVVVTGNIYSIDDAGVTVERNGLYFYLDGEMKFDASQDAYGGMIPDLMDASLGNFEAFCGINNWDTVYKGFFDDLYLYDYALTDAQVKALYDLGDPSVQSVAEAPAEVEADPVPQVVTTIDDSAIAIVGNPNCDNAFWSSFTDSYELKDGGEVKLHFNNYGSGINNWENYVLAFTNTATTADLAPSADNYEGYKEYGVLRADAFGWGFPNDTPNSAVGSWGADWPTFLAMMKDADVTLTITRKGSDIAVDGEIIGADGVTYTYTVSSATTAAATDPMYVFLTGEKSYIELLSADVK